MKRKVLWILLISCMITACSSKKPDIEMPFENIFNTEETAWKPVTQNLPNMEEKEEMVNMENLSAGFGLSVLLPENSNWIQNAEYKQIDENHLEIYYYDNILEVDCKLLAVRDSMIDLSDNLYDESLEETWVGSTASGQSIYVKVQHSVDGKMILATWEYDDYKFAIQADLSDDVTDTNSIPKTALSIIDKFE